MSGRHTGGGCLSVAVFLLLVPLGCMATPLMLLQQADGQVLASPPLIPGAPLDRYDSGDGRPPGSGGADGGCGQQVTPPGSVRLSPPLVAPLSSPFGWRPDPIGWGWDCHTGVDWAADAGTPVRAGAGGRVAWAGWHGGYGKLIRLDHGDGLETWYAHLSRVLVEPDQAVAGGDVIGLVGSTGRSTGAHLHFEVRVDGAPVDPGPWLEGG